MVEDTLVNEPKIRLQKFLSLAGVCSRRKGETYIVAGRVSVNDRVVTELGTKIDPLTDRIALDGIEISSEPQPVYIALHKPIGVITSCDHGDEKIVLDLVDIPQRVYPIGRLDKDSSGLLLLTNDGELHQRLSHPSYDHEKEYEVSTGRPVDDGALQKLAAGMPLMGRKTRPAQVRRISGRRFRIVLKEGRNRQIRRMVRKIGHRVVRLKRTRIAHISLGRLPEGQWRYLSASEKKALLVADRRS